MTSSAADAVTSESPDVNASSGFDVTVVASNTKSLTGRVSPSAVSATVMVAVLLILSLINLCGNGFTLIVIRLTRKLHTKNNVIMTSMLLSYFMASFSVICFNSYTLLAGVQYHGPCRFNLVITGFAIPVKIAAYVSALHTILVSVERYVAIVHPLRYETAFTDRTLKWAIFATWMTGTTLGMTYAFWLIDADLRKCALVPLDYHLLDVALYTLVCSCLIVAYRKILAISWRHHRRIEPQPANSATRAPGPPSLGSTTVGSVTHGSCHNTADRMTTR